MKTCKQNNLNIMISNNIFLWYSIPIRFDENNPRGFEKSWSCNRNKNFPPDFKFNHHKEQQFFPHRILNNYSNIHQFRGVQEKRERNISSTICIKGYSFQAASLAKKIHELRCPCTKNFWIEFGPIGLRFNYISYFINFV